MMLLDEVLLFRRTIRRVAKTNHLAILEDGLDILAKYARDRLVMNYHKLIRARWKPRADGKSNHNCVK
jgi:hypothetical protein